MVVRKRPLAAIGRQVIRGLQAKHKQHQGHFVKLYQALCKHPKAWQAGVPQKRPSASIPSKAPAGLTKEGAGIFGWIKKGYHAVKGLFHTHKKKIMDHVKKEGAKLAGKAISAAKDYAVSRGKQILERGRAKVESHARSYISKAEGHVRKAADKVDSLIQKHLPEQKTAAGIVVRIRKTLGGNKLQKKAFGATAKMAVKMFKARKG